MSGLESQSSSNWNLSVIYSSGMQSSFFEWNIRHRPDSSRWKIIRQLNRSLTALLTPTSASINLPFIQTLLCLFNQWLWVLWIKSQPDLGRDVRAAARHPSSAVWGCQGCLPGRLLLGGNLQKRGCLLKPLIQFISGKEIGVLSEVELLSEASNFGVYCLKPQVMDVKEEALWKIQL